MELWLICPQCKSRGSLDSRTCLVCGANLRNLPPEHRRYFLDPPEAIPAVPTFPETAFEPAPGVAEGELAESYPENLIPATTFSDRKELSLCEALDRILNKGAVLHGEVIISVADVDLVYLGLQVILASMETARGFKPGLGAGQLAPNLFDQGVCR